MKKDKNEARWDKFLQIRTMDRDDSNADSTAILMSRRGIRYWSVWQIVGGPKRVIRFWIMNLERGAWMEISIEQQGRNY